MPAEKSDLPRSDTARTAPASIHTSPRSGTLRIQRLRPLRRPPRRSPHKEQETHSDSCAQLQNDLIYVHHRAHSPAHVWPMSLLAKAPDWSRQRRPRAAARAAAAGRRCRRAGRPRGRPRARAPRPRRWPRRSRPRWPGAPRSAWWPCRRCPSRPRARWCPPARWPLTIAPASCPLPSAWGLLSRGAHPSQHPCNCSGPAVSVQHAPACWRRPRTTAAAGHARSVESCTGSRAAACPCRSHAPRALCEHASAVHPPCCDLGTGNPVPGGYPITGSGRARTWSAARSATSWIGCAAGSVAGLAVNRPSTSVSRTSQSARTSVATCRPPQQTLCRPSTPTLHVREQDQPVRAHQRRHLAPPPHQPLCRPFTQALTAERWPLLARLRWHELTGHVRSTLLNGF
jgi:hypothetical protein